MAYLQVGDRNEKQYNDVKQRGSDGLLLDRSLLLMKESRK